MRAMFRSLLFLAAILPATLLAQPAVSSGFDAGTALRRYLDNGDTTYSWELREQYPSGNVTVYSILLTSQRWRGHVWRHQLKVAVPDTLEHDEALLFIDGGSLQKDGSPKWSGKDDRMTGVIAMMARDNKAVTAVLRQIPNQPLYDGRTEDALIAYTLERFRQDGQEDWPLLFPMVKGALRAMDAVQEVCSRYTGKALNRFVVSGASKRGWTTWLSAAHDKRIIGMAPMVIDMLNMPVSMRYQLETWNAFSEQIQDYVRLGLADRMAGKEGEGITRMIDPYSYRRSVDMPKMLVMGTNDEYWPVDNVKNYIDGIPGPTILQYIPNVGHGLGTGIQAVNNLSRFFGMVIRGEPLPECRWRTATSSQGLRVSVDADAARLNGVLLWTANSADRDFRKEQWTSRNLGMKGVGRIRHTEPFPQQGYRSFFLELRYADAAGREFSVTTRPFLLHQGRLL